MKHGGVSTGCVAADHRVHDDPMLGMRESEAAGRAELGAPAA